MKKFVVEVETLGRRQTRLVPARNEHEARRNCTTAESNYRSMEDEDKQLLMMIEDIKEGREDLERMLEP